MDSLSYPSNRRGDDDVTQARTNVAGAFTLAGLVSDTGKVRCPLCGTDTKGKVRLFADGGWHCYKCGRHGDALGLLLERDYRFVEAVDALCGRSTPRTGGPLVIPTKLVVTDGFRADVDSELYRFVLDHGSVFDAVAYYKQFGISSHVVRQSGAVGVLAPEALLGELRARFGDERLQKSGLVTEADRTKPMRMLVNDDYPLIEPHFDADGNPTAMQFRASPAQADKVAAHKRGEGPYVPKFLSLRGAGPDHLLGCGLPRLASIVPSVVRVVEGFKDLLAARTLGWEAYALPGAGTTPPPYALDVLARHRLQIALDGDEAGQAGAENLLEYLKGFGLTVSLVRLPRGADVADLLSRRATNR